MDRTVQSPNIPPRVSVVGLVVAPVLAPAICGGLLALLTPGTRSPVVEFLLFAAVGSTYSYAVMLIAFLPCFCLAPPVVRLRVSLTGMLGVIVGFAAAFPVMWLSYTNSVLDLGPPNVGFDQYVMQNVLDPMVLVFPAAGFITAVAYWVFVWGSPDGVKVRNTVRNTEVIAGPGVTPG